MALGTVTGHKFDQGLIYEVATVTSIVVTAGISVWGVIKDHSKGVEK